MKIITILLILVLLNFCTASKARTEFYFANKLAREGLWKEAYFRWAKSLEKGKESAALYNNMAIALEGMGKLEEAEKMYIKALKLSPNNPQIKKNFDGLKKNLRRRENEN